MSTRGRRVLLASCLFLSGAAGLLYEVAWLRVLSVVFGHTAWAVTVVLGAFMGGLAAGGWLGGRVADRVARPVRAYAALEAAVGLLGLLTPLMGRAIERAYVGWCHSFPGVTARPIEILLALAWLLPPTALMGATLPLLSRVVTDDPRRAGQRVGRLYALNTWGAAAGAAAAGYLLLPALGVRATVWV
ncbi:MAG: fused MFS/spermidine synthase, partial [Myxococcota bacterium]